MNHFESIEKPRFRSLERPLDINKFSNATIENFIKLQEQFQKLQSPWQSTGHLQSRRLDLLNDQMNSIQTEGDLEPKPGNYLG